MILTNRLFIREAPSREAKSIYIFCEGIKREYQYFKFFKEMDSRINVEIYKLHPHEDNSPSGLLDIAKKCIIKNKDNPNPKYSLLKNDEVWIVSDTDKDKEDSRESQLKKIREFCSKESAWFIAQSNPCFEVWLFYHLSSKKPSLKNSEDCSEWKELVNTSISGGFDSRKHTIYIEKAILNAENNFNSDNNIPTAGCTEVFKLSKNIFVLVEQKVAAVLKSFK